MPVGPDIDCFKIEMKEGESLEGKCNVTGNPIPKVRWLKDGRTINLTDPLRRDDTGRYKVKADQNTDRNSSVKEIQVNVLCEFPSGMLNVYFAYSKHLVGGVGRNLNTVSCFPLQMDQSGSVPIHIIFQSTLHTTSDAAGASQNLKSSGIKTKRSLHFQTS